MPEYPEYDRDITLRLVNSETRIKNWVITGVVSNLLLLLATGGPLVYYLGQLSAQNTMVVQSTTATASQIEVIVKRMDRLEFEASSRESWMIERGYKPPYRRTP